MATSDPAQGSNGLPARISGLEGRGEPPAVDGLSSACRAGDHDRCRGWCECGCHGGAPGETSIDDEDLRRAAEAAEAADNGMGC